MQKSKVYKYNLLWQVVRIRNKKFKRLQDKLHNVTGFLYKYPSPQNKERVLNYLEGLALGYKDIDSRLVIYYHIGAIEKFKPTSIEEDTIFLFVDTKDLLSLYKDLYKRNTNWLKGNYRNKDLNEFLEGLYIELKRRGIDVDKNFDIYPTGISRYKFIY